MRIALFYVSGHGFGHAVRAAEVIRALEALESGWSVIVRTTAPSHLFAGRDGFAAVIMPVSIEPGIVEGDGTLSIDATATIERLDSFVRGQDRLVAAEVAYVRELKPDIIVADIPFLAGEIGAQANIPVLGISNFTWDYIYEPFLAAHPSGRAILQTMRDGYDRMQVLLRLPFHHEMHFASPVIDVGLVTQRSRREKTKILDQLGIAGEDERTRVYLGLRGAVPVEALRRAAEESPDCLFFHLGDDTSGLPDNTQRITIGPELAFADILSASDTVICKLGYGMVAACVASGTSLVFPQRVGFREDVALDEGARRYLRSCDMSAADFQSGNWRAHLQLVRNLPPPADILPLDGAETCARMIVAAAIRK